MNYNKLWQVSIFLFLVLLTQSSIGSSTAYTNKPNRCFLWRQDEQLSTYKLPGWLSNLHVLTVCVFAFECEETRILNEKGG